MRTGRLRSLCIVALMMAGLLLGVRDATPAAAALQGDVQISGHGFGHGRGLSQWGSLGYAVDHNWPAWRILNHYYGGTVSGTVGNIGIGVELLSRGGKDLVVTAPALMANTAAAGTAAVLARRNGNGTFSLFRGPGCGGPWTLWNGNVGSGFVLRGGASAADPANHIQICESGQVRGYRGDLQVVNTGTSSAVVNRLLLEDYLRGVLPREMPASWASAGGGRGAQALQAQAVAARSYAISSPRNGYATTCDTTACQVYGGEYTRPMNGSTRTSLEDARTDAAIVATAGVIRRDSGGDVVRTEFSASTGGWTAGGAFPAVQDHGDATPTNPNHNWSVAVDAGVLAARLGVPPITGISVTQRNGLGADGGRVLRVVVDTTSGQHAFTGNQFRSRVGLKSDWFSVNVRSYTESLSFTRALYNDLLGRPGGSSEVSAWAGAVAAGAPPGGVARTFLTSTERLRVTVAEVYAAGLRRVPDARGFDTWVNYLRNGATYNDLNAAIFSSPESLHVLGGGDTRLWVDGLYQALLGRSAAASERTHWAGVAATRGRHYVSWFIAASTEARKRRLNAYYMELLQRPVDPSGLRTWMPPLMRDGDIQVQVFIASSAEYWSRAAGRFP
jgi:SpoIID/LytB domain protein